MRRFVLRACTFLGLQTLLLLGLWNTDAVEQEWLAATIDKHALLASQPEPRILFVGGSSVAFGSDSATIGRALDRNPVNMGLYAGLGLEFILDEVEPAIRRDDLIVLSFAYGLFYDVGHLPFGSALLETVLHRPANWRYVQPRHYPLMSDAVVNLFSRIALRRYGYLRGATWPTPRYSRAAHNEFGDHVGHWGEPSRLAPTRALQGGDVSGRYLRRLGEFIRTANARGARVVYLFPAIARSAHEGNRRLPAVSAALGRVSPPLTVLNSADEMLWEDDMFFDTDYHLIDAGIARRTSLLIERLRER